MSGTFPASPVPSSVKFGSIQPSLVSVAHSLKRQVRTRGGQRWKVSLRWAPMLRADFMPIWAFVMAQDGQYGSFTWVPPVPYSSPRGSWGGTPLVNGASQSGSAIIVDGFPNVTSNVARAGDFIKFSDTKVYMVTADAASDSSGEASLAIKPKLITSPANNEAVVSSSVSFAMMLASDLQEHDVEPGGTPGQIFSFGLDLIEAY